MKIAIVQSPEKLSAIFQLKWDVFVEEFARVDPKRHEFGQMTDKSDKCSTHLAVLGSEDCCEVLATGRLVHGSDFQDFPFSECVDQTEWKFDATETTEISGVCTLNRCRNQGLMKALLLSRLVIAKRMNRKVAVCVTPPSHTSFYENLGFVPIKESVSYHGKERSVLYLELSGLDLKAFMSRIQMAKLPLDLVANMIGNLELEPNF